MEAELTKGDVRLTMGGEPTFVSVDDMDGAEWNYDALGEDKRQLAGELLLPPARTDSRRAALLHFGQGKWYPGEPLPRWALTCLWRTDGMPLWRDAKLLAEDGKDYGFKPADAQAFARVLAGRLGLHRDYIIPAYEDVWDVLRKEQDSPGQLRSARAQSRRIRPSARASRDCCKGEIERSRRFCPAAQARTRRRCDGPPALAAAAAGRCAASICIWCPATRRWGCGCR